MDRSCKAPAASARKQVLVLDDNPDICALIAAWLQRIGYEVRTAPRGRDFLRSSHTTPGPDLVITDILMPDGDGFEVIEFVRRMSQAPKVIAISGGGRFVDGPRCLQLAAALGANAVLQKPFSEHELSASVQAVLGAAA